MKRSRNMKKILAIAAAAALTAGVSAYAANPFSDVSPDDWAYQAVSDLSDQGVVEGYPDGTFKGERNMTRYELAQVIARLMAREDQLNAEQKATLDRLAGEYADELANLGVRVSNLEKKVGNISWSGNARMRWVQGYDGTEAKDKYDGRIKITAHADVNDSTYVQGRLRSDMNFKDSKDANTYMEELIVHHQFGDKVGVTLGRQDLTLGQTGTYYDDEFDGVIATFGGDKLALDLGYGRFKSWDLKAADGSNTEAFLGRLYGSTGRLSYDAEYINMAYNQGNVWGLGLTANITDKIDVFGDFYKNTDADNDPQVWTAGLGFGHTNWKKPGTFRVSAQYIDAEKGSIFGASTYNVSSIDEAISKTDVDYWLAQADVILAKNVKLHGEYAFDVDAKDGSDYDNLATVSLNYVF